MAETFLAVSDSNDALAVAIPCDIVDAASDDVILALGSAFTLTVPDADGAGGVTTSYVKARGRKTRNCRLCRVLSVLGTDFGMVYGT